MESKWAADNLRVIRTLMERSAIYRRALAPLMLLAGSLGTLAAVIGWFAHIESPRAFVGFLLAMHYSISLSKLSPAASWSG